MLENISGADLDPFHPIKWGKNKQEVTSPPFFFIHKIPYEGRGSVLIAMGKFPDS
jgi:hypothetical protein